MSQNDDDHEHDEPNEGEPDERWERLSAHLDRGWDLLQKGDVEGATRAADEARAVADDAPETHTLLGAIAATAGDAEAALERFEHAMELDPEYVDPILHAAEIHVWPLGDYAAAVKLCERALDVAEEEDEYLDALLLKAEAELALGDQKAARKTLEDLPPSQLPEPQLHVRAGRAFLDLGDADSAERHLQAALEAAPDDLDALHTLGLVHEERGDLKRMAAVFLRVREADLKDPAPPWSVGRVRFEALGHEALEDLPERIRELIANVPVIVADYPSIEVVAEGNDPRMMGFFSGVPYPEKQSVGGTPHLDCVFLYQRNIERVCRTPEEVEEEIRNTILHETGHFFGLSEEDLEEMGLG